MASFEIIVRPVVFPDIRPPPAQPIPPPDDPTKGFATIHGNGGKQVTLTESYSSSTSSSAHREVKRRVDEARVYQKKKDGKVNKKNFVDIEAINRIWLKGPPSQRPTGPDVEPGQSVSPEITKITYRRIEQKDNIEITKKDVIKENE